MSAPAFKVRRVPHPTPQEIDALAAVLVDCVEGGASVSFMKPFSPDRARAYWRGIADDMEAGARALIVAEDGDGIIGTVQLVLAQPENQPHRADVSKMLVHRRARRKGVGEALMRAVEDVARAYNKTVLVLDTASETAARLYERAGWTKVGVIPDYALLPDGGLCDTVVYFRKL
jgi:GNAT superfamily N-acetyltransferase